MPLYLHPLVSTCLSFLSGKKHTILTYNNTSLYICSLFLKRPQTSLSEIHNLRKKSTRDANHRLNVVVFFLSLSQTSLKLLVKLEKERKKNVDPFPFKVARVFVCAREEEEEREREGRGEKKVKGVREGRI